MVGSTAQTISLGDQDVNVQIEQRRGGADLTFTAGEEPGRGYMRRLEGALRSWCQTIQGDGGCCTSIHANDHAIRVIVTDSSPGELQSHLANLDVELSRNWDRKQRASAASASGAGVNTS